jgi:hypothetical protein
VKNLTKPLHTLRHLQGSSLFYLFFLWKGVGGNRNWDLVKDFRRQTG